ncbi:MAG: VWA domain-containing protein, partial [Caldilineaceae bacterium]
MSFGAPLILLLLPIVLGLLALLMVLSEQRRRESLAGLGNASLVARLTSGGSVRLRHTQWALWLGAAALLLFALARPQWGEEVRTVQREGIQVVVALDVSTSMLAD